VKLPSGARALALGVVACAFVACAATPDAGKARDLTPAERDSLSQVLEPLLTAAGLWRGPVDGCAAAFVVVEGEPIGAEVIPHAPCRVKLVLTDGALTRLDRATLRVVLAHELGHLHLSHEDARQARAEERKKTEKGVKSASSAASKAAKFIPGVGGWVSKGISTTRKAATAAMEVQGNAYLGEEERAADAVAVTYLNEVESSGCGALVRLLAERLGDSAEEAWTIWLHEHPVSTERVEALAAPCPTASR
jgi:predicted Zn-dependent protease